jgi:hypothetical protein
MSEYNSIQGERIKELATDIEKLAGSDPELAIDRLKQIELLAQDNNLFAHYVAASYYIFGRYPQTFEFHRSYAENELTPYVTVDSMKGFGHYIQAISAPDNEFQEFQIQALYEMYMTISGNSALFETFKIDNCPEPNTEHPLSNLFDKKDTLLMMLFELGHSEIYLDTAQLFMDQGESADKIIELLNLAVEKSTHWCLRRDALYKLGEIHYFGKYGLNADIEKAKAFWGRIDEDRALAKVANHYLKDNDVEGAKAILLSLKDPEAVLHLFSDYPEVVEAVSKRDTFTGLLDSAFGSKLEFPQVEQTIDARRFYSELTLEQILAEDMASESVGVNSSDLGQDNQDEADKLQNELKSDTPTDDSHESHIVLYPVETKEVSIEDLAAINDAQNDIVLEFEIITDDKPDEESDTEQTTDSDNPDQYNEDQDPFGIPDFDDDYPDID